MPTVQRFTFNVDSYGNVTPTSAMGPAYVNDLVTINGTYGAHVYADNNMNQCQWLFGVDYLTTDHTYKIINETASTIPYSITTSVAGTSNGTLNVGSA